MTTRELLKVQRELASMVRLCAAQLTRIRKLEAEVSRLKKKLGEGDRQGAP